jgi:hypothetical protein
VESSQTVIGIQAGKESVVKVLGPQEAAMAIIRTSEGAFFLRSATFKDAAWQIGPMVIGGYYDSAATAEREPYATMSWLRA